MHRVVRFLLDLPARIAIGNCRSRRSTQFDFDIRAQTSDISNATGTCRTNWSDHIPTTPIAQRFDDATFHNDRPEHKKTKKIMGHEPNKVKIKTACVSREHNGGRTIRRKKCLPSTILQHTAFRGHDHSKIISGKLVHHLPPRGRMVGVTFYNNKKEIKIVRTEEGGWEVGGRGCWVNNICYERAQLTHDRKKKMLTSHRWHTHAVLPAAGPCNRPSKDGTYFSDSTSRKITKKNSASDIERCCAKTVVFTHHEKRATPARRKRSPMPLNKWPGYRNVTTDPKKKNEYNGNR